MKNTAKFCYFDPLKINITINFILFWCSYDFINFSFHSFDMDDEEYLSEILFEVFKHL